MTVKEQELLKQWLTNEELRLANFVDVRLADTICHRSAASAVRYFEACIMYNEFRRCMRSLDCLLLLFP